MNLINLFRNCRVANIGKTVAVVNKDVPVAITGARDDMEAHYTAIVIEAIPEMADALAWSCKALRAASRCNESRRGCRDCPNAALFKRLGIQADRE